MTAKHRYWSQALLRSISRYPKGKLFISDELRVLAMRHELKLPPHSSAWGGLLSLARKEGLIQKTGRYVRSAVPTSHGHLVAEWRRI